MKAIKSPYKIKKIFENTYSIMDNGMKLVGAYLYLLVGNERALLIDSGYGGLDLGAIIKTITDKEVVCVCTHGHVDHALGAYQFEKAYMHTEDFDLYHQHSDPEMIRKFGYEGFGLKPSKKSLRDAGYRELIESLASKPRRDPFPLDDIKEFDLGDRTIRWVKFPGHTQGSCVFWDEKYNTIFDGDAASIGVWLFLPESSSLADYRANLIHYQKFVENHNINRFFSGHSNLPSKAKKIQKLISCCETVLSGKRKGFLTHLSLGDARIVPAAGSLIFCNPGDTR